MPRKGKNFLKRQKGQCYDCTREAVKGGTRCRIHVKSHREGAKRVYESRKAKNRCARCNLPLEFCRDGDEPRVLCITCAGRMTKRVQVSKIINEGIKNATAHVFNRDSKLRPSTDI